MLTERGRVETQADHDVWTRALEFAIKGLNGYLTQYDELLQNDRVGLHAKQMIDQAQGVLKDKSIPLQDIQKHEQYLQHLHHTLRKRVEKLQKGDDPDATWGRTILRAFQYMMSENENAREYFTRALRQHNQETHK